MFTLFSSLVRIQSLNKVVCFLVFRFFLVTIISTKLVVLSTTAYLTNHTVIVELEEQLRNLSLGRLKDVSLSANIKNGQAVNQGNQL